MISIVRIVISLNYFLNLRDPSIMLIHQIIFPHRWNVTGIPPGFTTLRMNHLLSSHCQIPGTGAGSTSQKVNRIRVDLFS
jgi:hypothetical protein